MRPTSIVALIVSVLLIIAGLSTCIIAQNMANAKGEALFSEIKTDGVVNTFDLTDVDISKIELLVTDAEINIYGKSKTSYVEFINFRENYYTLSTANKVLSFDEIPDVVSMLKFWENGFSFKGMRHIFNFKQDVGSKKTINVYLNSDMNIKIFNITAENCVLNLENLTSGSDYNINVQNGEIYANTLKTTSAFKVNGENIKIDITSAVLNTLEVKADTLDMQIDSFRASNKAIIEAVSGKIDLVTPLSMDTLNLDLDSVTGAVTVNGMSMGSEYKQENGHDTDNLIEIITDSADISIRQNSLIGEVTEPDEETASEETTVETTAETSAD